MFLNLYLDITTLLQVGDNKLLNLYLDILGWILPGLGIVAHCTFFPVWRQILVPVVIFFFHDIFLPLQHSFHLYLNVVITELLNMYLDITTLLQVGW